MELSENSLELATLRYVQAGLEVSVKDVGRARSEINKTCRAVGTFMERYDAILCPTLAGPAWDLGFMDQNEEMSGPAWFKKLLATAPFTALFNMTGQPGISVPIGLVDGLPVAAQIVGRMNDEATILQLARDLEVARPLADMRPSVYV